METDDNDDKKPDASRNGATNKPAKKVERIRWWHRCALLPAVLLLKLWGRTLRFRADPEVTAEIAAEDGPILGILWHNRLFFASEAFRCYRPGRALAPLVSASKDGAWLDAFFSAMGMHPVRGSSSWRGTQAIREIVKASRNGFDIGITPDGPRGPRYECKMGAAAVGTIIKRPIYLFGFECRHVYRLNSWDAFMIPLPFAKVNVRIERLVESQQNPDNRHDTEALSLHISTRLRAINRDVDAFQ